MNRRSILPGLTICILAFIAITVMVSGCASPFSGPVPSVTISATYVPPSPTPIPVLCPTPTPQPGTTWNGEFVKLYGNVNASDDHVIGQLEVYYSDKNYWDDHPLAKYDTETGGAYSLEVRANVPFKVKLGYLYVRSLAGEMNIKLLDKTYVLQNDTLEDFNVMTSNVTTHN
jgi:hypothetical protein